jgi:hypothetical protein
VENVEEYNQFDKVLKVHLVPGVGFGGLITNN